MGKYSRLVWLTYWSPNTVCTPYAAFGVLAQLGVRQGCRVQ